MKRLKDLADYRAHDSIKEPFLELLWYSECQYNYLLTIIGLLSKYGHLTRQSLPLSSAQQFSQIVHAEIIGHKRFYTSSNGINNNNNNFRVSNIRVSNRTLIYNVCPEAALT